jgi:hypothetical protein
MVSSTHLFLNVKQYLRGATRQAITTKPVDLCSIEVDVTRNVPNGMNLSTVFSPG